MNEKIDVTKELAETTFNSLTDREKNIVIGILHKTRSDYIASGFKIDVPYYFLSLNNYIFTGIDYTEFLEIEDSEEFSKQAIYYISRYLINQRG